jgi:uncharacterized membrane protein
MTSMSLAGSILARPSPYCGWPLRSPLVNKLGERYFFGIFSLLSIAGLAWLVAAYRMAPFVPLWPLIPASGWFVCSGNPGISSCCGRHRPHESDGHTHAPRTIDSKLRVYGITRITRHPRLCGVSL